MNLYSDDFYKLEAPPAVEINVRPNILYTEEYSYLTRDELEVLFLLATTEMSAEGMTSFSFSGIKRQLGKHQQKITKAINRLVSKGLISKNNTGYSISHKGTSVLSQVIKLQNTVDMHKASDKYLEQRIVFNTKISLEEITIRLVGKWFGSFRYISHTEGKQLIVRWQLVNTKSSATLKLLPDEVILNIIPDSNDLLQFSYEEALEDLSQYIISIVTDLGVQSTIESEGWRNSSISEIEYAQRLSSWLGNYNAASLSEN